MKAVILGSTGLVGSSLAKQIQKEDSIQEVVLFNRRPSGIGGAKIKERIVDFENIPSFADQIEGDYLFCCLGTTIKKAGSKEAFRKVDYELPLEFAREFSAKKHVGFVLVSAKGANEKSPFFYNQVKGELERALKNLPLNKLVIVRPSLLLGNRSEKRPGEALAQKLSPLYSPFLPKKLRPVKAQDVARELINLSLGRKPVPHIESEIVQN